MFNSLPIKILAGLFSKYRQDYPKIYVGNQQNKKSLNNFEKK